MKSIFNETITLREKIAKILSLISISMSLSGVILILILLIECYKNGDWPFDYRDTWNMSHGPWRYTFGLIPNHKGEFLSKSLGIMGFSMISSFAAMLIKFNNFALIIFMICVLVFFVSMHYLYWLVD